MVTGRLRSYQPDILRVLESDAGNLTLRLRHLDHHFGHLHLVLRHQFRRIQLVQAPLQIGSLQLPVDLVPASSEQLDVVAGLIRPRVNSQLLGASRGHLDFGVVGCCVCQCKRRIQLLELPTQVIEIGYRPLGVRHPQFRQNRIGLGRLPLFLRRLDPLILERQRGLFQIKKKL